MAEIARDIRTIIQSGDYRYAFSQYKDVVFIFSRNKTVMEVGSGRSPIFTGEEIQNGNIEFYANDISEQELSRSRLGCRKAVFDICGTIPDPLIEKFDFIFSRMVLEHVSNGGRYWSNILSMLKKGGYCLTFHPTLYSPPFVANYLLPEESSANILKYFFPNRNDGKSPKFPAKYSFCFSGSGVRRKIRDIGFSHVDIIPFYGHDYFRKIPLLKQVDGAVSSAAMKHEIRMLSSFAYTIAVK